MFGNKQDLDQRVLHFITLAPRYPGEEPIQKHAIVIFGFAEQFQPPEIAFFKKLDM